MTAPFSLNNGHKTPCLWEVVIRPATDQDCDGILDLLFGIWIGEYHFHVKPEDFPDLHSVETHYTNAQGMFFVATHNDRVVGTLACQKLSETAFVLKRMFVAKAFRGSGVAQDLFNSLIDGMRRRSSPMPAQLYLSTKEDVALAAKHFYIKNGFKQIIQDELPVQFPFFYEDDLYMTRIL